MALWCQNLLPSLSSLIYFWRCLGYHLFQSFCLPVSDPVASAAFVRTLLLPSPKVCCFLIALLQAPYQPWVLSSTQGFHYFLGIIPHDFHSVHLWESLNLWPLPLSCVNSQSPSLALHFCPSGTLWIYPNQSLLRSSPTVLFRMSHHFPSPNGKPGVSYFLLLLQSIQLSQNPSISTCYCDLMSLSSSVSSCYCQSSFPCLTWVVLSLSLLHSYSSWNISRNRLFKIHSFLQEWFKSCCII